MGVKAYRNEKGEVTTKGKPAGFWFLWSIAVIMIIIGIPLMFINPVVGIINWIIFTLIFFIARKYGEVVHYKKIREYFEAEKLTKTKEWEDWN